MPERKAVCKTRRSGAPARGAGVVAGGFALACSVAIVSYPWWRTRCLTWGAIDDEANEDPSW